MTEQIFSEIPYLTFGEAVTLTNCDREPIHVPGHAQAHGAVVSLGPGEDGMTILQVSANITQFCGIAPENLLGKAADALFSAEQSAILSDAMEDRQLEANPLYLFSGPVCGQGLFHVTAHTYQGVLNIEMEAAEGNAGQEKSSAWRPDPQTQLRQALTRLRTAATLNAYCHIVCEAVQQISGFDRVMVYRFHDDGHGEVIAEVVGEADMREPYLGLHYPETDIPKQARALYLLNAIRLMPDAKYEPAPISPALSPRTGQPLDMTHCLLRGYSPMYTEYLTNMGARASMSLAIVRNGALWGLIACHHQTPRWVPYDVRTACEFLSDVVSLQITDKKAQEDTEYRERILDVHRRLMECMVRHGTVLAGLTEKDTAEPGATALSLLDAAGCAVLSENQCRLLGQTPPEDEVRALVRWLTETRPSDEEVWATGELASVYPPAEARNLAAGLLALRVAPGLPESDWVLWFRPEVAQTVNWGGNPNKPYETGPLGDRLTPRKSFDLWQEAVRGRSLPWTAVEVEGARRLRVAIAQVIVRRAEELERLNAELARSNVELDSFAYVTSHDLKEPLRGINNYIRFLREDHGDLLNAEAEQKLDTVVRITRRMDNLLDSLLHYSLLGRQDLALAELDFNWVLAEVLETLRPRLQQLGVTVHVPRPLPESVFCDPVQAGELLTNLITNAAKYSDKPAGEKSIEVGWLGDLSSPTFFVRDNGIGIPEKHHALIFRIFKRLHARGEYEGGTGAGLTICEKIVERHGGRLWLKSIVGEGTTFFFTLAAGPKE
ncbi:MAG: ATP-binding protein [Janthinobacterium lividum]